MLINLSNHPSSKWPAEQIGAAEKEFKDVEDIPFPKIPPQAEAHEVEEMARQLLKKIKLEFYPPQWYDAIHIMGEMTFTLAFVYLAQKEGFTCLASTTERLVNKQQDGSKNIRFQFCRFRPYPSIIDNKV